MEYALMLGQKISATEVAKNYTVEKQIRKASSNGELKCPDPNCQHPTLKYCHGDLKSAYFAHKNNECCDYALFDKENPNTVRNIRRKLYEHLVSLGYNVQIEEKVLPHHYTHLLVQGDGMQKIAIEIDSGHVTANYVDRLSFEYKQANIHLRWIIIGETGQQIEENQVGFLKRYQLNESENGALLVVNEQCSEITQYKIDQNSYTYRGKNIKSENYPEVYSKSASVQNLIIDGTYLTLAGFESEYSIWLKQKKTAFQKFVSQKESEERLKTALQEQLASEKHSSIVTNNTTTEKNTLKSIISDEECRAEILPKMNQQEEQAWDSNGRRWIRCRICGKIDLESSFSSYGGPHQATTGICRNCAMKNH